MQAAKIGRGALVFLVVGTLCSGELGSLWRVGCYAHDEALSAFVLPVLVPLATTLVGAAVAWLATRPRRLERVASIVVLVPGVGLLTGVVAGLVWWPDPDGLRDATATALAVSTAALVLIAPLAAALGGGARPRSLLDDADRFALWARAGALVSVASVLTLPRWKAFPACAGEPGQAIVVTALGGALLAIASSVLAVHLLRARLLLASPPSFLDLGVGDGRTEIVTHAPTAYRHPASPLRVVWGDVEGARRRLRAHGRAALAYAAVGLAACAAGIFLRG
jgi:hypothetical protein